MSIYRRPIRQIHLEPTSECNARCPQCPRTYFRSLETHPLLKIDYWRPEQLAQVLADPLFSELDLVLINGTVGEIVMHPNPMELIEVIESRDVDIDINTNGGAQRLDFWTALATKKRLAVNFGIDGLADTHHLYRRNTKFETVIRNARAFVNGGGRANWVMNVFKHNQHQVEQCRQMAADFGFASFTSRPSARNSGERLSVVDKNFKHEYYLESVYGEELRTLFYSPEKYSTGMQNYRSEFPLETIWLERTKKTNIQCRVAQDSSVFLSFDGRMWPCCWTSSGFDKQVKNILANNIVDIYKTQYTVDPDFNNIVRFSPSAVYEKLHGFSKISESWSSHTPCTSCYRACSNDSEYETELKNLVQTELQAEEKRSFANLIHRLFARALSRPKVHNSN